MSHRENSLTPWLSSAHNAKDSLPPAHWDEATGRWSDDDPKTNQEKHHFCLRRTGVNATFLPPSMYDRAEAEGCDMRWYVKTEPIEIIEHKMPTSEQMRAETKRRLDAGERLGASHVGDYTATERRVVAHIMSDETLRNQYNPISPTGLTRRGNPIRKHIGEKQCGGKETPCLPGKSGNCVACCDED